MTLDECDELVQDLQRVGVQVREVVFDGDEWNIYCWHPDQGHGRWVRNAKVYREAVSAGWIPGIPRDAFDSRQNKPRQ